MQKQVNIANKDRLKRIEITAKESATDSINNKNTDYENNLADDYENIETNVYLHNVHGVNTIRAA